MTQESVEALGLNLIGVSGFLLVAGVLLLAHLNPRSRVDLTVLLLDDKGRVSRSGFIALAAFLVTTWCIVHMEIHARLDWGGVLAYLGACIGGKVASDAVAKISQPQKSSSVVQRTEVVQTEEK